MNLSPISLFVYNRPLHTKKTIEALKKNHLANKSILYIFSDGPRTVNDETKVEIVRKYLHSIKGFKRINIIKRKKNYGLAKSVITGVTEVINKHGTVIVLEDDLVSSPQFLGYINYLLDKYKYQPNIFSVTGYNHPKSLMKIPKNYQYDIYFNARSCSWSWGTWKDRWEKADWEIKDFQIFLKDENLQKKFNFSGDDKSKMLIKQMNGELDSWAIRWDYTHFKNNTFCVYPVKSYINNIGHDSTGVHCDESTKFNQYDLNKLGKPTLPLNIEINDEFMSNFRKVYKKNIIRKTVYNLIKDTCAYKYYLKVKFKK